MATNDDQEIPCPCCGRRTFCELGADEICSYCNWEDDPTQWKNPDHANGANHISLNEFRERWRRGADPNVSSNLKRLCSAYLNQDFDLEFGSADAAIAAFATC